MTLLQEAAKLSIIHEKNAEALEERNIILESIGDAFFVVDRNWAVFASSVDSMSYREYHEAIRTNKAVYFEDYFKPLDRLVRDQCLPIYSRTLCLF